MSEYFYKEARNKAQEWGYKGHDLGLINYARESSRPSGCKWVWTDATGNCLTCGDVDWSDKFDEEEVKEPEQPALPFD